jgi:hypothetical protein
MAVNIMQPRSDEIGEGDLNAAVRDSGTGLSNWMNVLRAIVMPPASASHLKEKT